MKTPVTLLAFALAATTSAVSVAQVERPAATLTVLSTNAITGPVTTLAEQFRRETQNEVKLEFLTSPVIARRLAAGEVEGVDVLVLAAGAADQAVKDGKARADSRAAVGKVGVGVAIRRGGNRPDVSSVDALSASLRQADALLYSQGASGAVFEKLMATLGMADLLKTKGVQLATGDAMLERLSTGGGVEMGFTQVSEIMRAEEHGRVSLVGPLPAAVQGYTVFDAVVMAASPQPEAARAFVRALTAPAARKLLAANGWEF